MSRHILPYGVLITFASLGPLVGIAALGQDRLDGQNAFPASEPIVTEKSGEVEKRLEAVMAAEALLSEFKRADVQRVKGNQKRISETVDTYEALALPPQPLRRDLLVLKARALAGEDTAREGLAVWQQVVVQNFTDAERLGLLLEAAATAGLARDVAAARGLLSRAKVLTEKIEGQSDILDIQFKVRELLITGSARDWREVEDEISDMRELGSQFPVWTLEQMNILLLEAELRLDAQPLEADKRESMRSIRAELVLAYEAQRIRVPQSTKDRYRNLLRQIDDAFNFTRPYHIIPLCYYP